MLKNIQMLEIETLVPHKGVMCLLDRVLTYGDDWVTTEATVTEDNIFLTEYGLPGWVAIEYMAQSISALAGIREIEKGEEVKIGFLLGTRKYSVNTSHFPLGSILRITASEVLLGANGLGAFDCVLESGSYRAEANLNVFQPGDAQEFFRDIDNDTHGIGNRIE